MVTALSFVICSNGQREPLLDEVVLPGILDQELAGAEIILVGNYGGRHRDRVRVIPADTGGELFYKPFQTGVEAARNPWIVDMDDDMLLAGDWGARLREARLEEPAVYGMQLLNPDGSLYGLQFDAIDNRYNGRPGAVTYFGASIAPLELYEHAPYPTYQSGDRAHAIRVREKLPGTKWKPVPALQANHLGMSAFHAGVVARTGTSQRAATKDLLAFLREHRIAWMRFADRYLDGRPGVTLADCRSAAEAAVGDPELQSRRNWLS